MSRRAPAILALLLLVGCLRSEDPEDFTVDSGFESGVDLAEAGRSWDMAMKHVVSVLQTDPSPFGDEQAPLAVTSYMAVSWEREGTAVTWTETLCDMESNVVFGTETTYPRAFQDAVGVVIRTGTLSGESTGARLEAGEFVDLLALALDDPDTDPMPTDAGDPAVLDADADGQPGVTVHVDQSLLGEADIYIAQRARMSLTGTAVAPDRIEGNVQWTREQVVLGASESWAEDPPEEAPDPDPSHSFFILQGVPDGVGCAGILRERDGLF